MFRKSCVFPRIFLILRQHSLASSKNDQQPVSVTRSALSTLKICRRGVGCRGKKTRFFMNSLLFAYLGLIKKKNCSGYTMSISRCLTLHYLFICLYHTNILDMHHWLYSVFRKCYFSNAPMHIGWPFSERPWQSRGDEGELNTF